MLDAKYVRFFTTLCNRTRLEIVFSLRKGPMKVGAITRKLGYDQSTISNNLRVLKNCGFVDMVPNGKERVYRLNDSTIEPLLKLVDRHASTCCAKLVSE